MSEQIYETIDEVITEFEFLLRDCAVKVTHPGDGRILTSHIFPPDVVRSLYDDKSNKGMLLTCSCGVAECAGYYDQSFSRTNDTVTWTFSTHPGKFDSVTFDRTRYEDQTAKLVAWILFGPWKKSFAHSEIGYDVDFLRDRISELTAILPSFKDRVYAYRQMFRKRLPSEPTNLVAYVTPVPEEETEEFFGAAIFHALDDCPKEEWRTKAKEAILGMFDDSGWSGCILPGLNILFDAEYGLDVIPLLIEARKKSDFRIVWPGRFENGNLIYAAPGHRDYRIYPIADYDITCLDWEAQPCWEE